MLKRIVVLAIFVLGIAAQGVAQRRCEARTATQLATKLAEAYEAKTMGDLDSQRPYVGRIRLLIEHSLAEDGSADQFEVRNVRSLAKVEEWLTSQEHDGAPARSIKPLLRCRKGVCTFNFDEGIVHNSLYLKRIIYGVRNGCPYIKTIHLLDGD